MRLHMRGNTEVQLPTGGFHEGTQTGQHFNLISFFGIQRAPRMIMYDGSLISLLFISIPILLICFCFFQSTRIFIKCCAYTVVVDIFSIIISQHLISFFNIGKELILIAETLLPSYHQDGVV